MLNEAQSRRRFLERSFTGIVSAGIPLKTLTNKMNNNNMSGGYKPNWDSLDSHECPKWFRDGKLGMYFHWGLSSVPGWAPRKGGTPYAEWYWYSMKNPKNPTWRYHRENYGENFSNDDFIPMFKAEKYDPDEWVEFAKNTGVKYIFVNSKHHAGFCMWPTKYTNRNAYRMGPKKDLIGPLINSARRAGLKVGFYYSFYEWYNPLYTGKPHPYKGLITVNDYVDDFMIPQIKELINLYHPDFFYFDGEWDHPAEFWKSREFVSYYYNEALKRGQDVLVNDRFGKGARGRHGDVYNVEYGYGNESEGLLNHNWSYWRGIGKTFGYNLDTGPEDCLSVKELVHMTVNGISKNGNFDINVGPTGPGQISEIEKQPLLQLGKWLAVNGEAIYGTRIWRVTEENEIRFTAKNGYVYAVFLKWPGEQFHIKSVRAAEGSKITMLGVPGNLDWSQNESGLTINFPPYKSRPAQCAYAWALKISPHPNMVNE